MSNQIVSVTKVIDYIWPFTGFMRKKWVDSVCKELGREISIDDLNHLTSSSGTYMHDTANELLLGLPDHGQHPEWMQPFIDGMISFFKERNVEHVMSEFYVEKPGEYCGHPDLLARLDWNGERVLAFCDFKTYKAYRYALGLSYDTNKRSIAGNKKKVALQLSLYQDALRETYPEYKLVKNL